eukprot:3540084-Amphidinium_carterae.1
MELPLTPVFVSIALGREPNFSYSLAGHGECEERTPASIHVRRRGSRRGAGMQDAPAAIVASGCH